MFELFFGGGSDVMNTQCAMMSLFQIPQKAMGILSSAAATSSPLLRISFVIRLAPGMGSSSGSRTRLNYLWLTATLLVHAPFSASCSWTILCRYDSVEKNLPLEPGPQELQYQMASPWVTGLMGQLQRNPRCFHVSTSPDGSNGQLPPRRNTASWFCVERPIWTPKTGRLLGQKFGLRKLGRFHWPLMLWLVVITNDGW